MKQKKRLTVKEVKELSPNSEVYTLLERNVYLVVVQPPKVILHGGNRNASIEGGSQLVKLLDERGIKALLVTMDFKDEIKILELKSSFKDED